ncbi:MAG: glutaminyl-peptide cyclotransferase [Deltaproteobacteria bacterium]|nr:glutaminyl-peptide cyclotransferase [Deltaproteobacteria bacterium]
MFVHNDSFDGRAGICKSRRITVRKILVTALTVLFVAVDAFSIIPLRGPLALDRSHPGVVTADEHSLNLEAVDTTGTALYTFRIVNVYPHDPEAFTQGLVFHRGYLYEGTGLYGASTLRKIELKTGKIRKMNRLPEEFFGEGITICRNRLIQLTWLSCTGFVYDPQSFRLLGTFTYPTEGWGITCDGNHLIMSDGTSILRFLDPQNFTLVRQIDVRDRGKQIIHINELEYVRGEIYANVWDTGYVVRISPKTGEVSGWIDLRGLYRYLGRGRKFDILNGIAYDVRGDRLFVTGKYWPKLFEIKLQRVH